MKKKYIFLILLIVLLMNANKVFAVCYKITDTRDDSVIYSNDENLNGYADKSIYKITKYDDVSCSRLEYQDNNLVQCGSMGSFNRKIPEITSWIVTIIQVIVPVILVIMGMIDFVKSIASQKDDEIKKGRQIFIKRLITSVIIFFIVVFVKMLISVVSGDNNENTNIVDCIDCFINNKCS